MTTLTSILLLITIVIVIIGIGMWKKYRGITELKVAGEEVKRMIIDRVRSISPHANHQNLVNYRVEPLLTSHWYRKHYRVLLTIESQAKDVKTLKPMIEEVVREFLMSPGKQGHFIKLFFTKITQTDTP